MEEEEEEKIREPRDSETSSNVRVLSFSVQNQTGQLT